MFSTISKKLTHQPETIIGGEKHRLRTTGGGTEGPMECRPVEG